MHELAAPLQAMTSRAGNPEDLGVGVALGQPMGVTAKYWLTAASEQQYDYNYNQLGVFFYHKGLRLLYCFEKFNLIFQNSITIFFYFQALVRPVLSPASKAGYSSPP